MVLGVIDEHILSLSNSYFFSYYSYDIVLVICDKMKFSYMWKGEGRAASAQRAVIVHVKAKFPKTVSILKENCVMVWLTHTVFSKKKKWDKYQRKSK